MEKARALASFQIEKGVLASTLDQGADLALDYSLDALKLELGRELTPDEKQRARSVLREALEGIYTPERWEVHLADVYSRHFTPAELDTFLSFLQSPVGLRLLEVQHKVENEVSDGGEAILEERLDEFVQSVDEALLREFNGRSKEGVPQ
jgi:hypothetical protein